MNFLFIIMLLTGNTIFASECKPKLNFGTKVKIINSTYSDWVDVDFVKGLTGSVVNAYRSKYKTTCNADIVILVSVCVATHLNCKEFALCETDIEVIK